MKRCPYCVKTLPFFSVIWQRLTFSEESPLVCPNCNSIISNQGAASIWFSAVCGGGLGSLLGKIIGSFEVGTIIVIAFVSSVTFCVSLYFTAPVRDSE